MTSERGLPLGGQLSVRKFKCQLEFPPVEILWQYNSGHGGLSVLKGMMHFNRVTRYLACSAHLETFPSPRCVERPQGSEEDGWGRVAKKHGDQ